MSVDQNKALVRHLAEMESIQGETEQLINVPSTALYAYPLDFTRHVEWASNLSKIS